MKRILTMATCAAALALPALAGAEAARTTHFGHLTGAKDSQVKFKESLTSDGRAVTAFAVRDFTVACKGGNAGLLKVAKLAGSIKVSAGGGFKAKDDNGETVFRVKGNINRNKSVGSFRYSGQIESEDGTVRACDSGKLGWITRP
jgi:hypothetical protein